MSKKIGKALSLVVAFGMMLSLCACGSGSSASASASASVSASVSASTQETAADDTDKPVVHEPGFSLFDDSPVTIYTVGRDTVVVYIQNEESSSLLPSDDYEESNGHIRIISEDLGFSVNLSSFEGTLGFQTKDGGWVSVRSEFGNNFISREACLYTFTSDNIVKDLSFTGKLTMTAYEGSNENEVELASVDPGAIVKNITFEEFEEVIAKVYPVEAPQGNWEGTFITGRDTDYPGAITINIEDNGLLHIKTHFNGVDREYAAIEYVLPDSQEELFYCYAQLMNGPGGNTSVNIQYTRLLYYETYFDSLTYTYVDDSGAEREYHMTYLNKFDEWHQAPADYKDEDVSGLIHRTDAEDSKYFAPAGDDYIIEAFYDTTKSELKCDYYTLYSFDVNGHETDQKTKAVFKTEEDANAYYDKMVNDQFTYSEFYRVGEIVYGIADPDKAYLFLNSKTEIVSHAYGNWYLNCHYITGYQNEDGTYYDQYYISKPYTEAEYTVSIDDVLYWQTMPYGAHRSIERSETSMTAEVNSVSTYIKFEGSVDDDYRSFSDMGEIRMNGTTITGSSCSNEYDYDLGDYVKWLNFTEIDYKEVATVTQYKFKLDDPYKTDITFDNFKTKTADMVLTQKYDMTQIIEYSSEEE